MKSVRYDNRNAVCRRLESKFCCAAVPAVFRGEGAASPSKEDGANDFATTSGIAMTLRQPDGSSSLMLPRRQCAFKDIRVPCEVSEIEEWGKTDNSPRLEKNIDLYITGSNSKPLAGELSAYLTLSQARTPFCVV